MTLSISLAMPQELCKDSSLNAMIGVTRGPQIIVNGYRPSSESGSRRDQFVPVELEENNIRIFLRKRIFLQYRRSKS